MGKKTSKIHKFKYRPQIIGYDSLFLNHCLEEDIKSVQKLRRDDRKTKVKMKCDEGHIFDLTPYEFFCEKKHCIHCIRLEEVGAGNLDESLISLWNEPDLDIFNVSESSNQLYNFFCPFCGSHFKRKMVDIINQIPKCQECHDGQEQDISEELFDSIYLFND